MQARTRTLFLTLTGGWLVMAVGVFQPCCMASSPSPASSSPASSPPASSPALSPRDETTVAVRELHRWLNKYPNGPRWRRFVRSDDLLRELKRGEAADSGVVGQILQRYDSGAAGLDKRQFVAVREAMRKWVSQLDPSTLDELSQQVRDAADQFRPVTDADVAAARKSLEKALGDLQKWLATGTASDRAGWTDHLKLAELKTLATADGKPNIQVLTRIMRRFYQDDKGLEITKFLVLRQAVRRYRDMVLFDDPALKKAYFDQLNELASRLEAFQKSGSSADRAAIGQLLGWLDRAGQAGSVVSAVTRPFSYPNLHVQASQGFVAAGFKDKVDQVSAINETILGTPVRGQSHTRGTISAQLVPNDQRAAIRLLLVGSAASDNVGYSRGVRIYSSGHTRIRASKLLYLDGERLLTDGGLTAVPATADCDTDSHLRSVAANCGLVRRIAWKRASRSQGAAEREASRKAERRIAQRVDKRARGFIADARDRFRDRVRGPLRRRDALPQKFQFRSSATELLGRILQSNRRQVAASSGPPRLTGAPDVSFRLHETAVGNFTESLVGGRVVTDGDIRTLLEENDREVPEALSPDGDPWSITFVSEQPIVVDFGKEGVRIALRGRRFTRDGTGINDHVEISATYQIELNGPDGTVLRRTDDVVVDFVGLDSLKIQQVAFKSFLQSKFRALFEEVIEVDNLELPGRWKDVGRLAVHQLAADNDWLTLSWMLAPTRKAKPPVQTASLD